MYRYISRYNIEYCNDSYKNSTFQFRYIKNNSNLNLLYQNTTPNNKVYHQTVRFADFETRNFVLCAHVSGIFDFAV